MVPNFPAPALPGSGSKGMISARFVKAPPLEKHYKYKEIAFPGNQKKPYQSFP